jgi:hypothetical protein
MASSHTTAAAPSPLHSHGATPLLSGSIVLPHALLDFGVRVAPVWPRRRKRRIHAPGKEEEQPGWCMTNMRGQCAHAPSVRGTTVVA